MSSPMEAEPGHRRADQQAACDGAGASRSALWSVLHWQLGIAAARYAPTIPDSAVEGCAAGSVCPQAAGPCGRILGVTAVVLEALHYEPRNREGASATIAVCRAIACPVEWVPAAKNHRWPGSPRSAGAADCSPRVLARR